jgi:hypothetical protein
VPFPRYPDLCRTLVPLGGLRQSVAHCGLHCTTLHCTVLQEEVWGRFAGAIVAGAEGSTSMHVVFKNLTSAVYRSDLPNPCKIEDLDIARHNFFGVRAILGYTRVFADTVGYFRRCFSHNNFYHDWSVCQLLIRCSMPPKQQICCSNTFTA